MGCNCERTRQRWISPEELVAVAQVLNDSGNRSLCHSSFCCGGAQHSRLMVAAQVVAAAISITKRPDNQSVGSYIHRPSAGGSELTLRAGCWFILCGLGMIVSTRKRSVKFRVTVHSANAMASRQNKQPQSFRDPHARKKTARKSFAGSLYSTPFCASGRAQCAGARQFYVWSYSEAEAAMEPWQLASSCFWLEPLPAASCKSFYGALGETTIQVFFWR